VGYQKLKMEIKSEIGELVRILMVAKSRGAKLNHKSAFEKRLNELIGANHTIGQTQKSIKQNEF